MVWKTVLLCLFIFNLSVILAQEDPATKVLYKIELHDGSTLIGNILFEDETQITLLTPSGLRIEVMKFQISRKQKYRDESDLEESDDSDPNMHRLFLSPTGRPLKTEQIYFSNYELFFPFIGIGITDFLSIAAGVTLVPGADHQLLLFAPKVTPLQAGNFYLSGGMVLLANIVEGETSGIVYSSATYGDKYDGVTVGLGYDFSDGEITDQPLFVFGVEVQISNSAKIITENWLSIEQEGSLLSFGVRFFGEQLSSDIALIYPTNNSGSGFPFLPWVSFTYIF